MYANSLRAKSRGVSLLELMVVISILAVLLAIGVRGYRYMQDRNVLNSELEKFYTALKETGTLAQSAGRLSTEGAYSITDKAAEMENETSTIGSKGPFFWQSVISHEIKATGTIGTRQSIKLVVPSWTIRTTAVQVHSGASMVIREITDHDRPETGPIVAQVLFNPDSTPVYRGIISIEGLNGSGTADHGIQIRMAPLGDITSIQLNP